MSEGFRAPQVPAGLRKVVKGLWKRGRGKVEGGGKGRGEAAIQPSAGGNRNRRGMRPRRAHGLPFLLLTTWCRNTWLSASQGAG